MICTRGTHRKLIRSMLDSAQSSKSVVDGKYTYCIHCNSIIDIRGGVLLPEEFIELSYETRTKLTSIIDKFSGKRLLEKAQVVTNDIDKAISYLESTDTDRDREIAINNIISFLIKNEQSLDTNLVKSIKLCTAALVMLDTMQRKSNMFSEDELLLNFFGFDLDKNPVKRKNVRTTKPKKEKDKCTTCDDYDENW